MFSDRELVDGLLVGDESAWRHWESRLRPHLARIAVREFRFAREDTEDLFQELVILLLAESGRELRAFRGEARLTSWICAVWRRLCVHAKRRREMETRPSGAGLRVTRPTETRLVVRQALGLLSPHDRSLLRMRLVQGQSYAEISAQMGISTNAIGPCLARAKERLKRILDVPARNTRPGRPYNL
jgi:RNA polymerase sigma factor (sigma-70 family)